MAIRIFASLFMCSLLFGCFSMKPMDSNLSAEQMYQEIEPGDELIIHKKDKTKITIVVTKVNTEQIESDDVVIRFEEIEEIYKEGISIWKTAGAVVVYPFIFTILVLFVLA